MTRLCKDCKHYKHLEIHECHRDAHYSAPDLVTGESKLFGVRNASNERKGYYPGALYSVTKPILNMCGKEGRYFEPMEKDEGEVA